MSPRHGAHHGVPRCAHSCVRHLARLGIATLGVVASVGLAAPADAQQADVLISAMRRVTGDAPAFLSVDMRSQSSLAGARGEASRAPLRIDASSPALRWRGADLRLEGAWLRDLRGFSERGDVIDLATSTRWHAYGLPLRVEAGFRALTGSVTGTVIATTPDASTTTIAGAGAGVRLLGALDPVQITRRLRFAAAIELYRGDSQLVTTMPGLGQDTGVVFPDTLSPRDDEVPTTRTSRAMHAVSSVSLGTTWRRVELDLRAWQRMPIGVDSRRQLAPRLEAALETSVSLSTRSALVGMLSNRSYGGEAPGPHMAVGLRWSTGRRTPPAVTRAPGLLLCADSGAASARVRVHAPGARRVELEGDLTNWQPRPMRSSTPDGWWELRVTATAEVQRVRIRVDEGPWKAPAGHPAERSDFGGEVAVLRHRSTDARCGADSLEREATGSHGSPPTATGPDATG